MQKWKSCRSVWHLPVGEKGEQRFAFGSPQLETATFVPVVPPRPRRTASKSKHGCGKRAGVRCFPLNSADGEDRLLLDSQFNPSARRLKSLAHISAGEGADLCALRRCPPAPEVGHEKTSPLLCWRGSDLSFYCYFHWTFCIKMTLAFLFVPFSWQPRATRTQVTQV